MIVSSARSLTERRISNPRLLGLVAEPSRLGAGTESGVSEESVHASVANGVPTGTTSSGENLENTNCLNKCRRKEIS